MNVINYTKKMFILYILLPLNIYAGTFYLIKQWHLLPKISTQDIELSKKLSQFKSQKDVYLKVTELIENNSIKILLAEGCEKIEINNNFKMVFNSWGYQNLENERNKSLYEDIMTHIPLKVEVKEKEKVKTLCIDNLQLIEKHQLALSDVRGYVGYFMRMKEFREKKDEKSFSRYATSLLSESENKKIKDPILYAKNKALDAIDRLEKINQERENQIFNNIKDLKLNQDVNVAFIIGGTHVDSLRKNIEKIDYKVEVYTPAGYVENDSGLIEKLKDQLK